jgi:DNA repair protein RecN (Recombination protein N)
MLTGLVIRDVVLIERLDLTFGAGLTALTGETGAGKSILLDALGLALGERSDSTLVRHGAEQAIVSAEFLLSDDHDAAGFLAEQGLPAADTLVLRRVLGTDGRSRGFVNDQPVGIGIMRQLGALLVEVQGQFDRHGLMNAATHRVLFDAFAGSGKLLAEVTAAWEAWRAAASAREAAEAELARLRSDEALLHHTLDELTEANPQPGEEEELAAQRTRLMHRAQLDEATATALEHVTGQAGAQHALVLAARAIDKAKDKAPGQFDAIADALGRALIELDEAASLLEAAQQRDAETADGDAIEARLFALRALARKHGCSVEDLPALREQVAAQLATIDQGDLGLRTLAADEQRWRGTYIAAAARLSDLRRVAIPMLESAVAAELRPLKLDRARLAVVLAPLDESDWGPSGVERVTFEVATNPGAPPGPLARIASGGELARLLLAFKVVLARISSVPTLVFDEVDAGVGGAVADAVGDRLSRLGRERQVLVVTHSPQVAARGDHHWRVAKLVESDTATTRIDQLNDHERREEVARMLSGADVTNEARAAARRLLERPGSGAEPRLL